MIQHESKKMTHLKAILLRSLLFLLDMGIMTSVNTEKAPARSEFYTPKANGWVKSQILTFCTMSFVEKQLEDIDVVGESANRPQYKS